LVHDFRSFSPYFLGTIATGPVARHKIMVVNTWKMSKATQLMVARKRK
jgi:hypothetical protein